MYSVSNFYLISKYFQTSSQEVLLQQDDLPRVPQFWLLAVCLNGTLADIKFDIDSSPIIQGNLSAMIVVNTA